MSFSCPDVRARFAPYAAEALASEERRFVREHLAGCEACREEAVAADPTLLFAANAPFEDVSAADRARILEGVRAGVALKQAERRLAGGPVRRKAAVAAAAAVVVLTLALSTSGGPRRASAPTGPASAAVTPAFTAFVKASADGPAGETGTATVYEIAPGAGSDEPRVVWIVDRSLDI